MPTATSRSDVSRTIDLAELLDRHTPLSWFEAVAIGQELCAGVLETRQAGQLAGLDLENVVITADGGAEVRGVSPQGLPTVPQVAHVLLTLLGESQTLPVQLRLLALQEASPAPGCATLRELSERLAPFERPNRRKAIREVYERSVSRPAPEPGPPSGERAAAARLRPARPRWWTDRRVQAAAASAVLLLATGAAAFWLWQWVGPLLAGDGNRQKPDAGATVAGGGTLSAEAVERIRATARRIWLAAERKPAAPPPEAAPGAQLVPVAIEARGAAAPATVAAPPAAGPAVVPDARRNVSEYAVFSADNAEVAAPVLLWPHLPTSPRAGVHLEDLPLVELVVSPAGEVESAKLVSPPAAMMPVMMLSAIKAWRFDPAKRDGKPVRYRLAVRLTNQ
jgi:hypothetical protein